MISEQDLTRIKATWPRSPVWDTDTQKAIDTVRASIYREPPATISQIQQASIRARDVPAGFYCVRDEIPVPPEDHTQKLFFEAVNRLAPFGDDAPNAMPVPLEWVGVKKTSIDVSSHLPVPTRLAKLKQDTANDMTVFHVHGGNLFQGSTASYRPITTRLAALSGAQVVSVDYRLCPEHQLPAALLDVFLAYLALVHPPPDSNHAAIDPATILFTGDSAGGALLLNLLLILRQLGQPHDILRYHARIIPLPLPDPAGVATFSLVADMLQSLPSRERNFPHDLFLEQPWVTPKYPRCARWPTDPPSPTMHVRKVASMTHPVVVPCTWDQWTGFPPLWFAVGSEIFYDGAKTVARKAARQGVSVTWREFEAMPHCFFMLPPLQRTKQAAMVYDAWAAFFRECAGAERVKPVQASRVAFADATEQDIPLDQSHDLSLDVIQELVDERARTWAEKFQREWESYNHGGTKL